MRETVLVLCPGVRWTNQTTGFRGIVCEREVGESILPAPNLTTLLALNLHEKVSFQSTRPLRLCYSKHQKWCCSRLGFDLVGCSEYQLWSSKACNRLQCRCDYTVKVKLILKISAGSGTEFSQLQSRIFSEKTRAVHCVDYWPCEGATIFTVSLPLIFCYTSYIISVDAPDCCLLTPPFSHVTLNFLSERTPSRQGIHLCAVRSWTDAVSEDESTPLLPSETRAVCLLFVIICASQACRKQPHEMGLGNPQEKRPGMELALDICPFCCAFPPYVLSGVRQ